MIQKLSTWFLRLIRKNHLKAPQAALGAVVEVTASYTCKGQRGVIIDNEYTLYPTVQLEDSTMSGSRFLLDELELVDDSKIFVRPARGIALDQMLEFARFCNYHLTTFPKFILVSPLTLKHLTNEGMRPGVTWYTTPTIVDVGECPVLTELVIRGIPIIDKLPVHMIAKKDFEIPHFVAGIGLDNGVYYLTALLNPEMAQIPQNKQVAGGKSSTQLNSEFTNLALERKAKARWNF